jgi:hypothetical protein
MDLPYDPDAPTETPPMGADKLVWLLSRLLHEEHEPDCFGMCLAAGCRRAAMLFPCKPYEVAQAGLLFATWPIVCAQPG